MKNLNSKKLIILIFLLGAGLVVLTPSAEAITLSYGGSKEKGNG